MEEKKTKKTKIIAIIALFALIAAPTVNAQVYGYTSTSISMLEGEGFNIGNDQNNATIYFTVISGDLNGTIQMETNRNGGVVEIRPTTNGTVLLDWNTTSPTLEMYLKLNGRTQNTTNIQYNFTAAHTDNIVWGFTGKLPADTAYTFNTLIGAFLTFAVLGTVLSFWAIKRR
jgi:hypothetical protein